MATFLFTWELGSGLGHVTVIKPLAMLLKSRGHQVVVALRDLSSAKMVFGDTGITWLQAPIKVSKGIKQFEIMRTFAHVLGNTAFSDINEASGLLQAWLNLFDLVRPDAVICDHSPVALLAARIRHLSRAPMGPGFYCPAIIERYPDWRPSLGNADEQLARDEQRVLDIVNQCARQHRAEELPQLSKLYAGHSTILGTYSELDPFGHRNGPRYRGAWGGGQGIAPWWPPVKGKKVFAYVKEFTGLRNLLNVLREARQPTIAYCSGVPQSTLKEYAGSTIAFASKPVEFAAASAECDVAISHASHGTAATMLLAGKPQLLFPTQLEQRLTAQAIVSCGAGLAAKPDDKAHIAERLQRMLAEGRFTTAAERVQSRYLRMSPVAELARAADELEGLVENR